MSNQGYGRNPADYGPFPGQEAGYGQAAYPDQAAGYAGQDAGYGQAGYAPQGAGYSTQGMEYEQGTTPHSPASHASVNSSAKGFVGSLFDFGFTSFVTPKAVKVVYVLIMAGLALTELAYLIFAFKVSAAFGIISLVILCPLSFFVYLALWRILLELFVVIFRIADDLRSIRERGES
jgi:Domain of unknown function (DUF4282)